MRVICFCLCLIWPISLGAQTTDDDRGYIQALLEDALSGDGRKVQITGFAGLLSSRATIEKITIADEAGVWLTMTDVAMIWERTALLSGALTIDEISVGALSLPRLPIPVASTPSPEAKTSFALPELPVSVTLKKLSVERADLGAEILGQSAQISVNGSAQLLGGEAQASLALLRKDKGGSIRFVGGYSTISNVLDLDLDMQEPRNGLLSTALGLVGAPSIDLTLKGSAPIDAFRADMRLATNDQDRLSGVVTLETDADGGTQRVLLDVSGDISPLVPDQFHAFLGNNVELTVAANRDVNGALQLDNLNLAARALTLTGTANISADGWPQRFDFFGKLASPDGPPLLLPLPGQELYIDQADFLLSFDAAQGELWRLNSEVKNARQGNLSTAYLSLSGVGKIAQATQDVSGDIALAALGVDFGQEAQNAAFGPAIKGKLRFDWRKNTPLSFSNLDFSGIGYGLTGGVTISGLTDLAPMVATDLKLEALDLEQFSALTPLDLSGAADLAIKGSIHPLLGAFDLTFNGQTQDLATGVAQLDPVLNGPGILELGVLRNGEGTRVMPLSIATESARIVGDVHLAQDNSYARVSVELDDMSLVVPELSGAASILVEGKQTGEDWNIDLASTLPADSRLQFSGIVTKLNAISGKITARIGRLAALSRLVNQNLQGRADLSLSLSGALDTQHFTSKGTAEIQSLQIGNPTLDPFLTGQNQVAFDAKLSPKGEIRIETLSLSGPHLNGTVSGIVSTTQSNLDLDLRVTNLGLIAREISGPASITGNAAHTGGDWRIALSGSGPGGITLSAQGAAHQDFGHISLTANGRAPLALANRRLAPRSLGGTVEYDLAINGPPALQSLSGTAKTQGARLSLPALRMVLDDLTAQVFLTGNEAQISLDTQLPDGGSLRVDGPINLAAPFNANLTAQLRNAILRDPTLFETSANGDLTLTGPLTGGARIGGQINLGLVELRIPQIGPSYASLAGLKHLNTPADVQRTLRFAGLSQSSQETASSVANFPIDLNILATNRIFVRGRGLDAELGGSLRLTGTTQDIVPVGQFDLIRGRLDLLRRRLELTEGSVSLRGSFDPQLNFAATTQVDGTDITIGLSGPASEPDLKVTSSPELPQDQVLALFLFGRDVTSLSALQAVQLAGAIRTLSGQGGLGLTQQIRGGLGLDDLDIGTDDSGTAQARVGKYISDNIYTDATINSAGDAQINLNLDINQNLTLRGRVGSSGETGVGIFFERDY